MGKKEDVAPPAAVQVFELTMNNSEDQDELNRRLRKPGEGGRSVPPASRRETNGETTSKSPGKKKRKP